MTIFYIDDFKIDLSRSVITKGEHQAQVEPKVLKVLLLLAQRQNQVVTHQEIMEEVWQGTEVVPNALQRCIAILRKELGDDAKSQTIIATHPRIGYRLVAKVSWQTSTKTSATPQKTVKENNHQHQIKKTKANTLIFAITLLLAIAVISIFWPNQLPEQYSQIQRLTHTDAHETHAIYNPNAEYVIFNRYAGDCKSHIWARHLASGQESQLTSEAGYFGTVSFTADGRELVFAAKKHCNNTNEKIQFTANSQMCWSIATLDFALALSLPQAPHLRYQCQAEQLGSPKALSNHQYAFLQSNNGDNQLMIYNDLNKQSKTLYKPQNQYIYHYDYDPKHQRLAVISRDRNFNHLVELINEKGQLQNSHIIRRTPELSQNQLFLANFEPQGQYLLATNNNKLYKITLDGQLQITKAPAASINSVVKHPETSKLLAVQGNKDIDIALLTIGQNQTPLSNEDLNKVQLPFNSLIRSTAQDRSAQYQPNGEHIAFISDRSGQDQIWLWQPDKNQANQLSTGSSQHTIHHYSWSPNGKHLAWASNDKLAISDLNGNQQLLNTAKPIYSVLSWYQDNQLLVLVNDPTPGGLYQLNLTNNKLTPYNINQVEAAWVYQNQLIYSKQNGEVFTRSLNTQLAKTRQLEQLNGKALLIYQDEIYSVDKQSLMLNKYDMQGQFIQALMPLKATAWKITDLKNNQLLLSQFISISNDIVVLN